MATFSVFADPQRAADIRDGFWLRIRFFNFLSVVDPYGYCVKSPFKTETSSSFPVIQLPIAKQLHLFNKPPLYRRAGYCSKILSCTTIAA